MILSCLLVVGQVLASDAGVGHHGAQGYGFFGPFAPGGFHFGAGGERIVYKGLAVGGELGYAFPREAFVYGLGLLSVNGSYHLNHRTHWKISPFATAGYTVAFRGEPLHLANAGGGLNYWLSDRMGLRVEFRGYFTAHRPWPAREFRIGFAFR